MKIYLKNYVLCVLILGTLQSLTAQTNDHDFAIANNILKKFVNPITETPKENLQDWLVGTLWEFTHPKLGKHLLSFLSDSKFKVSRFGYKPYEGEYVFGVYGNAIQMDDCTFGIIINKDHNLFFGTACPYKEGSKFDVLCGPTPECIFERIN